MLSREAADNEAAMFVRSNRRLRKKWIIGTIELSVRKYLTQWRTTATTSSPTGRKVVSIALRNFVLISRGS
jgi:hypothetical protein